ncbi:MAG: hypothetical protein ACK4K7_12170 [Allosphingosinicella sp.]|uniref:hypothetical protein n=1 Tax=Allosphingosinicella sp. TaxID=2823234 RepID=UPI0039477864
MKPKRSLSRRSFLARVAGGVVLSGGAMALTGCATTGLSDSDPSDPMGAGRGLGPRRPKKGCTDTDQGPNSDRAGIGRGSGTTDSDPTDARGCGRAAERGEGGVTDSDSGPDADPAGGGRGSGGGGTSDSDSGPLADPVGRGRGSSEEGEDEEASDSDSGPDADPAGRGRWRRNATPI